MIEFFAYRQAVPTGIKPVAGAAIVRFKGLSEKDHPGDTQYFAQRVEVCPCSGGKFELILSMRR